MVSKIEYECKVRDTSMYVCMYVSMETLTCTLSRELIDISLAFLYIRRCIHTQTVTHICQSIHPPIDQSTRPSISLRIVSSIYLPAYISSLYICIYVCMYVCVCMYTCGGG